MLSEFVAEMISNKFPEIKAYYDELGADRIKAVGYKEAALKNEILNRKNKGRLFTEFKKVFKSGMIMTTEEVKSSMNEIYSNLGIKKNAIVSHLEKEYGIRCKSVKISMDNGSRKNGWEFL